MKSRMKTRSLWLAILSALAISCSSGLHQDPRPGSEPASRLSEGAASASASAQSGPTSNDLNFPADFLDEGANVTELRYLPEDKGLMQGFDNHGAKRVGGFGGNVNATKQQHLAARTHRPVILLHGQGGKANGQFWGFRDLYQQLLAIGYQPEEIWAPSYLGSSPSTWADAGTDNNNQFTNNIDEIRAFIKKVMRYLDVDKVDVIGHSMGCTFARLVFLGYTKNGSSGKFDSALKSEWSGKIGSMVLLCGANYGFDTTLGSEWKDNPIYTEMNSAADISALNIVAAVRSVGDFVDASSVNDSYPGCASPKPANVQFFSGSDDGKTSTSYIDGAAANFAFYLSGSGTYAKLEKHQAAIRQQSVFDAYRKNFPNPLIETPIVRFDTQPFTFYPSLTVKLSATRNPIEIQYNLNSGANGPWTTYPADGIAISDTGTIYARARNNNGWGPVASQTYTKVVPGTPSVSFNPVGGTFSKQVTVTLTATENGHIEYNLNNTGWTSYTAPLVLTTSSTIAARASNSAGTSPVVSQTYTITQCPPYQSAYGTVTDHYLAKRLDLNGYLSMGSKYGYIAKFYLYKVDGASTWTDVNPCP